MEYHYKAFISYRHAELDMKVAAEIQNRLERYHIPGSIRKQTGLKTVGRIFRDKDELPSTSDLNDNIKEAIRSSEYLICICSPRYIESVWCRKEIEFFLESHDKSHVLTVLAEGDPYEVVPEILCKETVTVKDEDGNDVTIEAPLEPLSCDYRIDRHRARTEELPRLAAVLIGCRYADLRQKMRRRQMRLTALAAAAAAVLLAYFAWSYVNIRRNYRQALINQSEYLAASAQEALNDNDNLLAAQLSLAALPDGETDRPIVPKALYTLSKAVGAYESNEILNFRGTASYTMATGRLSRYIVSPDAAYLVMSNLNSSVEVYDLTADALVKQVLAGDLLDGYTPYMESHGTQQFVLWTKGQDVSLIRYSDASVLWHQKFVDYIRCVISLGDDSESPLLVVTEKELILLDAGDGEIRERVDLEGASGGLASVFFQQNVFGAYYAENKEPYALCPDSGCVCLPAGNARESSFAVDVTGFLTYYYETGRTVWTPYELSAYVLSGMSRDEDGRILLTYAAEEDDMVTNAFHDSSFNSSTVRFREGRESVELLREGSGETLWKNTLAYEGLRESAYVYQDLRVMKGDASHPDRELAVAATSNRLAMYDIDTGEAVKEVNLTDWIVSVEPQDPSDNQIRVNGYDGTQYLFTYFDDYHNGIRFMSGGMDYAIFVRGKDAASGESQFIIRQDDTIRLFKGGEGDTDWTSFDITFPKGTIYTCLFCGTTLVLIDSEKHVYAYDLSTGTDLWQTEMDDSDDYTYAGDSGESGYIYFECGSSEDRMLRMSAADGSCEIVPVTTSSDFTGAGRWYYDPHINWINIGSFFFYRAANYDTHSSFWFRYSMIDGSLVHIKMPYYIDNYGSYETDPYLFAEDGSWGIIVENDAGYLVDFEKKTVTQYSDPFPGVSLGACQSGGNMFAIWDDTDKTLHVYGGDGKEAWKISDLTQQKLSMMRFYNGDLYVAAEDNFLYRFRASDGKPYGMIESPSRLYPESRFIDVGNDTLVIDTNNGSLLVIDLPGWTLTGDANSILLFCGETKQVIDIADRNTDHPTLGACPFYTPQDLIDKGNRFVGDHTLTEAEKTKYGLN